MAIVYGDFTGTVGGSLEAFPLSFSGNGVFNTTPLAEEMMQLLPSYYYLGNNVRRIMELVASSLLNYQDQIMGLRDQLFVATATWGLKFWEELVGLPISEDLPYESRRVLILNKLKNCSSEKCFVEGLEAIVNGTVLMSLLDPVTNPYQINIELRTSDITYNGPVSAPTVSAYGAGPLTGHYVYKVTYGFPELLLPSYITTSPEIQGETSSGVSPVKTNEQQKISASGTITGGTFTISYDSVLNSGLPPNRQTTAPIPWNASSADIYEALTNLSNITSSSVQVTGGSLPFNDVIIEFIGAESGFSQNLITIDGFELEGGGYLVESRVQSGGVIHENSESNSISVVAKRIALEDVPVSDDGAIARHIYRKRLDITTPPFNTVNVGSPSNEYKYVGSIPDNITKEFLDDVTDESLSDVQKITFGSYTAVTPTYQLQFDSALTPVLDSNSNAAAVKAALDGLSSVLGYTLIVQVEENFSQGFKVTFNGGDVVGCSVPMIQVISSDITNSTVTKVGPQTLTERNSAFTYRFQRAVDYIRDTKPAHLHVNELRVAGFRASISRAGESV